MEVPLEAVTEKLAVPWNRTVTLEGWTVMTGGGPRAAHGLGRIRPINNNQIAKDCNPPTSILILIEGTKAIPVPTPRIGKLL